MDTETSLRWLDESNLINLIKPHVPVFKRIFNQCLNNHQEALLIGDTGFKSNNLAAVLSAGYYLAAKELDLKVKLNLQEYRPRLEAASFEIVEALEELKEGSIVIINQSDKLGKIRHLGRSFRRFARLHEHNFISTSSLGYVPTAYLEQIIAPLDVDYNKLRETHQKLKQAFDSVEKIRVETDNGTCVELNIKGRAARSSDGNFQLPGAGGNLPAGEVYIPPVEEDTNGIIIIDASSRNLYKTELIREPIKLTVKHGKIIDINGGVEADILDQSLKTVEEQTKYPERVRMICELGIGLNPRARVIGATIIDEKVLGTAHFGIGSNAWFGGKNRTIAHLDQVFRNPHIFVDGKLLDIKNF